MPPKSRDGRGGPHAAVPPGLSACLRCVSQAPEQRPEHTGAGGGLLSKAAGDTAGSQTQFMLILLFYHVHYPTLTGNRHTRLHLSFKKHFIETTLCTVACSVLTNAFTQGTHVGDRRHVCHPRKCLCPSPDRPGCHQTCLVTGFFEFFCSFL